MGPTRRRSQSMMIPSGAESKQRPDTFSGLDTSAPAQYMRRVVSPPAAPVRAASEAERQGSGAADLESPGGVADRAVRQQGRPGTCAEEESAAGDEAEKSLGWHTHRSCPSRQTFGRGEEVELSLSACGRLENMKICIHSRPTSTQSGHKGRNAALESRRLAREAEKRADASKVGVSSPTAGPSSPAVPPPRRVTRTVSLLVPLQRRPQSDATRLFFPHLLKRWHSARGAAAAALSV
ncbi:hypothetical protein CDD83_10902 [Cordyceps sp. RAO-2017]|nr:hypothetical protein CDD83_10902 [Cordyceps sp. RAO-2017]